MLKLSQHFLKSNILYSIKLGQSQKLEILQLADQKVRNIRYVQGKIAF